MRRRSYRWAFAILASAVFPSLSACATTADHRTLRVVVTNDDGVAAPGIDILVRTLDQLPDVEVRVFAPASDRSGTGESRSGHVLFGTVSKTRSGHPAVALAGFPSDTVLYADRAGVLANADVVVSGVNWGENLGTVIEHSGTIGAARTAARLGLPALAVSQGAGDPPDFAAGAALAAQWLEDHRADLLDGSAPPIVTSINVPTCPSGTFRGLMTVPVSTHSRSDFVAPDCASPLSNPVVDADDVDAFLFGFATLSTFDGDLRPVG
jgi:5'-nucleotidase